MIFSNDLPDWKQNFLQFRLATKLHKENGDFQVSALVYTMGREAEHVYKSFTLAEGDEKKFDVILAKFDENFVPKRNVIHEGARVDLSLQMRCKEMMGLLQKEAVLTIGS